MGRAAVVPAIVSALVILAGCSAALNEQATNSAALADVTPIVVEDTSATASSPAEMAAPAAPVSTSTTPPTTSPAVELESVSPSAVPAVSSSSSTTTTTTASSGEAPESAEAAEAAEPVETVAEPVSLGQQALDRVAFPWQTMFPEWNVVFRGPRDGIRALTYPQDKRVDVFIRESDTAATLHRVFAHELGHIIDVELNSGDDRTRWVEQRGISSDAPWWPNAEAPDFATGAGDFAEAFAVWETGVSTRSTVAGQPTADDLALLRELAQG